MVVSVTGARGYLGGWVVQSLRRLGHTVIELPGRTDEGWEKSVAVSESLIHLAWYSSAGNGNRQIHEDCVDRTAKILSVAKRHRVRVVFTSTASVYGNCHNITTPMTEEDYIHPNCTYTVAKSFAEVLVRDVPDWVTFRMGSLMGIGRTRTKTDLVVNHFAQTAYSGGVIECYGPECWKPVIHVRDAAAIIAAAADPESGFRGLYNLSSVCSSARTIAGLVNLQTGAEVLYKESTGGPTRSVRVDSTKVWTRVRESNGGKRPPKSIPESILEFNGRKPQPEDRNTPWTVSPSR
jgi:nucleoside-diphosphate-sugar epimerase